MTILKLKHLTISTLMAMCTISTAVIAEPTLEVSGAVEVEINSGKDHLATKNSSVALATVELGFDAQINDNVTAHILMLHEDGSTVSPTIDEGVITISSGVDPSASPGHHRPGTPKRDPSSDSDMYVYLSAGRMYVPFGNFESNMISDPLTLELAETQEAAVQVGFATGGFQASLYAFNGEADKITTTTPADNDVIDDFGVSIAYKISAGSMELDLGLDYINNIAETGGIEGALQGGSAPFVEEHTAGIALHAIINMDAFTIILEHISASDDFNIADLDFNGAAASPSASNIELAYTMDIAGREITFAIAHQSTSDMDTAFIGLPETRNMISVSTTVADDVGFKLEYSDASDYETTDGGSGESGGMLTAQLAVEF